MAIQSLRTLVQECNLFSGLPQHTGCRPGHIWVADGLRIIGDPRSGELDPSQESKAEATFLISLLKIKSTAWDVLDRTVPRYQQTERSSLLSSSEL